MLINKVAQSGLIVLDLEEYFPEAASVSFDISLYLSQGLILREKEFRAAMKEVDWAAFTDQAVAVWCSTDAIIPQWAYMLVTTLLQPYAASIEFGTPAAVDEQRLLCRLRRIDREAYRNERVIIKGCGKLDKSGAAYVEIAKILVPVVQSLMFGEPCSTVPVYKRK